MRRLIGLAARLAVRLAVFGAILLVTPAWASPAGALPEGTAPEAARLVGEGDAHAARAAALRTRIAALEARRAALRGEDADTAETPGGGLADGQFGPPRGKRDVAEVAETTSIVALDAEIDALTLEALGYERRAKAAWQRAATIDPAASDAILRRLIDTSLD